ncbi:MAG: hypothetical protein ACYSUM_11970 [Planctomycetota bacterium]
MRMFLPIKGPGGRYLTPNEKIALLILGLTLVLGVLTLLAGEAAYLDDGAQNPVFGFVAVLCRSTGGGIIALYALVVVWSGLIYFKGERVADVAPLGGRMFAALAVTVGVSGALGIAQMESAGELGTLVGNALGHRLGGAVGFPVLLMLMLLGFHLAGQGAWTALREPVAAAAPAGAAASPHAAFGYGLDDPAERRFTQEPPMPDDGDPTADERSLAVKQAMEEIERSQGVTIVDVEPDTGARPSIGEDVDAAPAPARETEEAEVQDGLRSVADALRPPLAATDADDRDLDEDDAHGLVPVPPTEIAHEDEEYEEEEEADEEPETATCEEEEAEYEEYEEEDDDTEDEADEEEAEYDEYEEEDDDAEDEEEEEEAEYDEYEEEDDDAEGEGEEEEAEYDEYEEEDEVEETETGFAKAAAAEDEEDAQADGFAEPESDDPYARGGLLRRMQRRQIPAEGIADGDRTYTTFDWRGRPLE